MSEHQQNAKHDDSATARPASASDAARRGDVDAAIERRAWAEALQHINARCDDDSAAPSVEDQIKSNMCRNFQAMERYRPEVYEALMTAGGAGPFGIGRTGTGALVPTLPNADGQPVLLTASHDPESLVQSVLGDFLPQNSAGNSSSIESTSEDRPILIAGIEDGYFLKCLHAATHDSASSDGSVAAQLVSIVEPDLHRLWIVMMLHDFSGVIEQPRYLWHVGASWNDDLYATFLHDGFLPIPQTLRSQVQLDHLVVPTLQRVARDRAERQGQMQSVIDARYAGVDTEELSAMLRREGSRPPRVLLATSRFTTVLRHSTDDLASALQALGFETSICMEPTSGHRFSPLALVQSIHDFEPDIFLTIDHLRAEYGRIVSAGLPFVCWIQDHLPHLTSLAAGQSLTAEDFVLTSVAPMYVDHYAYPASQCIPIGKMTRVPVATPPRPDAEDIVYVSNGSATLSALREATLGFCPKGSPVRDVLSGMIEHLVAIYARGESCTTYSELADVCDLVCENIGHPTPDPATRAQLSQWVYHPLNNTLFRHQALRWVIEAIEGTDWSLGLYGNGWEKNPEFASYARGPVSYGEQLQSLTTGARINLQIVPSFCMHQRLLDGLVANGFYLVREVAADRALPELCAFLGMHSDIRSNDAETMREQLDVDARHRFDELVTKARAFEYLCGPVSLIEWARSCMSSGMLGELHVPLPRFDAICFHNAETLRERLHTFMPDDELRRSISSEQREFVRDRLTYETGMRRVMDEVASRIAAAKNPMVAVDA